MVGEQAATALAPRSQGQGHSGLLVLPAISPGRAIRSPITAWTGLCLPAREDRQAELSHGHGQRKWKSITWAGSSVLAMVGHGQGWARIGRGVITALVVSLPVVTVGPGLVQGVLVIPGRCSPLLCGCPDFCRGRGAVGSRGRHNPTPRQ